MSMLVTVLVVVGVAYGILAATAALGLTSFSLFERYRGRGRAESDEDDGGLDDLF